MGILLTEAREMLRGAVLHAGDSFGNDKLDWAILETGERLVMEAKLNRSIASAQTKVGNRELDISSFVSGFTYYDVIGPPFLSHGSYYFDGASYNDTTRLLSFSTTYLDDYHFSEGDTVLFSSGTGLPSGLSEIRIASVDKTLGNITLETSVGASSGANDWTGTIMSVTSTSSDWNKIKVMSMSSFRQMNNEFSLAAGRPEMLVWVNETTCWLFPVPDEKYTLFIPYSQKFSSETWTPGTMGGWSASTTYRRGDVVVYTPDATPYTYRSKIDGNLNNSPPDGISNDQWQIIGPASSYPAPDPQTVTLNVPMRWAPRWLRTGARATLLHGVPGYPKTDVLYRQFDWLIEEILDKTESVGVLYGTLNEVDEFYGPRGL
ncbi:MAG: hypothetical protein D6706_14945 [Chloroflexi bacterium]|nr:MAG: hypothetical protein D6706_14945 [Chloroflexota bacterium]